MRTRIYKKQFWFNEEEKTALSKKANDVGMTESDYVRKVVLGYQLKEKPDERFYEVMKLLRNLTNNMNQIARKANTFGFVDEPLYNKEISKLNEFIDEVKRKFLLNEKSDSK